MKVEITAAHRVGEVYGREEAIMATAHQVVSLDGQCHEILKRVGNGSLDPDLVKRALQAIIQKQDLPPEFSLPPTWYVSPEEQIERVSEFLDRFGGYLPGCLKSDIPAIPEWTPRTSTEVLLLMVYLPDYGTDTHLQRTFDAWWEFLVAPDGQTKWRSGKLRSDPRHLWFTSPEPPVSSGVRWIVIDPAAFQGASLVEARQSAPGYWPAGVEVLALATLCPQWISSWDGEKSPMPNLAGLQSLSDKGEWTEVPFLCQNARGGEVQLARSSAKQIHGDFASPTVRSAR